MHRGWGRSSRRCGTRFSASRMRSPAARAGVLIVVAILVGVLVGVMLPRVSTPVARITGEYVVSGPVADVLQALTVDARQSGKGYQRDEFG